MFQNNTLPEQITALSSSFDTFELKLTNIQKKWNTVIENWEKDNLIQKLEEKVVKEVIRGIEELGSLPGTIPPPTSSLASSSNCLDMVGSFHPSSGWRTLFYGSPTPRPFCRVDKPSTTTGLLFLLLLMLLN